MISVGSEAKGLSLVAGTWHHSLVMAGLGQSGFSESLLWVSSAG